MRHVLALAASAVLTAGACSGTSSLPPTTGPTAASPARGSIPPSATPSPVLRPTPSLAPGITAVFDLRFRPSGIVAGGGLIWAEDHAQTNRVYAIDPDTGETVASVALGRPCDITFGFDRVWVADLNGGKLVGIDPTTHTVASEVTGLRRPCGVQAVDDAVWLAVDDGLARVEPGSREVTIVDIAAGATFPGSGTPLWASVYTTGELLRVDTAAAAVTRTVPHPAGTTEGPPIASAFDSVWVGGPTSGVSRLNPETGAVEAEIEATRATRLLVTDGGMWVTNYDAGVVERIDPASNTVVFRAELGGNTNGLTFGFGSIWVAETGSGRLYRIDPTAVGLTP